MAAAWIYPCWRTIKIRWEPNPDALLRRTLEEERPLLYYSWHAYSGLSVYSFRDAPVELMPVMIAHDGFKSQVVQRCMSWFGWHVWFYRRTSTVKPRQQIIELVRRTGRHIGLMADSGGPYGRVKPGLTEVARSTNALLVPFVLTGRGVLHLERPRRYRVPLPFCALTLHHADPLDGGTATMEQCQSALDELERRATAAHV